MQTRLSATGLALSLALIPGSMPSCGIQGARSTFCSPYRAYPAGVVRGPQVARPSPTSVTIAFATTAAGVGGVAFGTTSAYDASAADPAPTTSHAIALEGLAPASTYHYEILLDGAPLGGDHEFTTPPAGTASPVRFVVLGDTGTGCATELAAIALARSLSPDFVLNTGDLAYPHGGAFEVQERFVIPFADLCETTPLFPVLGNHDVDARAGQYVLDAFVLPENPSDPSSRTYAFDWGPCHVLALDSNQATDPASPQYAFLQSDLAATSAPWVFAFFHHPVYSSSMHGSTPGIDAAWVPVFDARHVDVVFNGHDHDYERTWPMLGGAPVDQAQEPDYVDPAGTVYVVTGGGGKSLYTAGTSAFTALSESVHHVTEVEIDGPTLTITAIRLDGTVLDRATITKTP